MIHPERLYDYTAGVYCGTLVTEAVMKKLVKLQTKHREEVQKVLTEGAREGMVFPSSWTLYHPEGEQTAIHYIDTSEDVYRRIQAALTHNQPVYRPLVFVAGSQEEAIAMAEERDRGPSCT